MGYSTGMTTAPYTLAFDLGSNSVGVAAVRTDDTGKPVEVLHAESVIHKGGAHGKDGKSRKSIQGANRRWNNRKKNNKWHRQALSKTLAKHGFPKFEDINITDPELDPAGPYVGAGRLRAHMAEEKLPADKLPAAITRIAGHMFNNRGYRNPWKSVRHEKKLAKAGYSERYDLWVESVEKRTGITVPEGLTPSQVGVLAERTSQEHLFPATRARQKATMKKPSSYKGTLTEYCKEQVAKKEEDFKARPTSKNRRTLRTIRAAAANTIAEQAGQDITPMKSSTLARADIIREWYKICETQGIPTEAAEAIATALIQQKAPGSASEDLAKDCPVYPGVKVARKNSIPFQEYRIAAMIGNLRHKGKPLPQENREKIFNLLNEWSKTDAPTWPEVIEASGLSSLRGFDGLSNPEYNRANVSIASLDSKAKVIKQWWAAASSQERNALLSILDNIPNTDVAEEHLAVAQGWIDGLDDDTAELLSGISLKDDGRAEYSPDVLREMTELMRSKVIDMHYAFTELYDHEPHIAARGKNIGEITGNPTVDVNLRIVDSLHSRLVEKFGHPSKIVVETSRDLAASEETRIGIRAEQTRRRNANAKLIEGYNEAAEGTGEESLDHTFNNVRRLRIFTQQSGKCLYCGDSIKSVHLMELDHIVCVARGGVTADINLAGSCRSCNATKGGRTFSEWADGNKAFIKKVKANINKTVGTSPTFKRQQISRLGLAEEPERPTESLSWASKELRSRLEFIYAERGVQVLAPNGHATAAARALGGFNELDGILRFPGEPKKRKTRSDRRHHAVDALVMTTLTPAVMRVIQQRNLFLDARKASDADSYIFNWKVDGVDVSGTWKEYEGETAEEIAAFKKWADEAESLRVLTQEMFTEDTISVTQREGKRLDMLKPRKNDIRPFDKKPLTEAFTAEELNHVADSATWKALVATGEVTKEGTLPENANRKLDNTAKVNKSGEINLFPQDSPGVIVGEGYADSAGGIHQLRVYRTPEGKLVKVPTLTKDLWRLTGRNAWFNTTVLPWDSDSRRHSGTAFMDLPPLPEFIAERGAIVTVKHADLWAKNDKGKFLMPQKPFEAARTIEELTGVAFPESQFVITGIRWDGVVLLRNLRVGEVPKECPDPNNKGEVIACLDLLSKAIQAATLMNLPLTIS